MYKICMRKRLSVLSPLYWRLVGCTGLNLWVGSDDLTMDFDFKHIFKRAFVYFCLYSLY